MNRVVVLVTAPRMSLGKLMNVLTNSKLEYLKKNWFFIQRCNSGRCIPKAWSCDGEFDCPSKEDEPPSCTAADRKCSDPDHFRCNNGKCIPSRCIQVGR